jgi:hypothetical protein
MKGDRVSEGRVHPVSPWVGIAVFVSTGIFNVGIVPSAAWHSFTDWLVR